MGVDTPYRTVKGKTVESYFKSWFSFRGAKRFVSGQFRIAGALGAGKYDYTIGRGVAMCELPGSSNTFQQGEGRWALYRYNFHEDDDEEQ